MKAYVVELRTRQKTPVYIGHYDGSLITTAAKDNAVLFDGYTDAHTAAMYWMLGTEEMTIHKVDVPSGSKVYRVRVFLSEVHNSIGETV